VHDFGDTLETLVAKLADTPLHFEPGTHWLYGVSTDVLARLVEVLSGRRFDEFLKERLFGPLGMHDTDFHVPPEKQHRFTTSYAPANPLDPMQPGLVRADDPVKGQWSRPRPLLSGGGGLCSTMQDYLAFVRMLVGDGATSGVRILKRETLDLMRRNHLADGVFVNFRVWQMPNTGFGLGFAVKLGPVDGEPAEVTGEYHWGGMAGTHSWLAPAAGIAGIVMTQRLPGFFHPFSEDFKRLTYAACAGEARRM